MIPDPVTSLGFVIDASVALAGFSGLVVVLGRRAHGEWASDMERNRFTNLVAASIAPMFMSLIALVMLHAGVQESTTWRIASIASVLPSQGYAIRAALVVLRARNTGTASAWLFVPLQTIIASCSLLQLMNAFVLGSFWPFLVAVIVSFGIATVSFYRLLLSPVP